MTSHDSGLMLPKPSSLSEDSDSRILRGYCRARELGDPGPVCVGPKAHVEERKCSRTYDENPNGLEMLPRTIPSLASQNPEGKNGTSSKAASQNVPRRKDEYSRTHTGVWCRSSSRKDCHLRI